MGTILEAAKLVVTVWLHEYWREVKLTMKIYLVPAVFVLMVITSMGIFGFLSKAHLDQTVPTGDVQAQVALIDEKITNERDTIANARSLLGQLDKAVVDISNAPDREVNGRTISSAERALQVRRQQARDRAALTKTIEESQARIVKLQEEKAPFAKELRKVEAEVGPIKYIAALIYGDNPDANLLEKAVRWVIIILVIVFDPLAIMMLLAATESYRWERERRKTAVPVTPDPEPEPEPVPESDPVPEPDPIPEPVPEPETPTLGPKPDSEIEYKVLDDVSEPDYPEPPPTVQVQSEIVPEPKPDDAPPATMPAEREPVISLGDRWPPYPHRGDLFVKTTALPTVLFKFNGEIWIQVDKETNDVYHHSEQYINYLISKISSGEYDPELLTEQERSQIESKLKTGI
jgi:hypothetical protein